MAIVRIQGEIEKKRNLYYEFDSASEPLGEGGMGKVYKGQCVNELTNMRRNVAIKFMYYDLPESVIERARREASIQLRNDNLVEMLGFIEIREKDQLGQSVQRYHVVSELLEGVMLDDLLQGKTTDHDGHEFPFAQQLYKDYQNDTNHFAIRVIRCIISGLMALHDAGYIHRDIDPTNIMVTTDGHIKLIDFGISKHLQNLTTHDKGLTSTGQFLGKAVYAAPELVLGDVRHQNQTTDIYAVGILLFQLIVGHAPFEGATHEVLDMQLHKAIPLNLIKEKSIRQIVAKATEKKQERRYQSAAEFRVALDSVANQTFATKASKEQSSINFHWDGKKTLGVAAGIAALVGITWGVLLWKSDATIEPESRTYADACSLLSAKSTVAEGLSVLDSLVSSGDQEAIRLKSQLSLQSDDVTLLPADVRVMKQNVESKMLQNAELRYAAACRMLSEPSSAEEGLFILDSLSRSGNHNATFLKSQLYFQSKREVEAKTTPDSILNMRRNAHINVDNEKAHRYLQQTLEQAPDDYRALFEMASDYIGGLDRTDAVERNVAAAEPLLQKALQAAEKNHDRDYVIRIQIFIDRYCKNQK